MPRKPHIRRLARATDPAFRVAGLALLVFAAAALSALVHLMQTELRHPATVIEFLAGAAGFVAASAGAALLLLGKHLLDPVTISERRRDLGGYRSTPIRR